MSTFAIAVLGLVGSCALGFLFGFVAGAHWCLHGVEQEPLRGVAEPPSNVVMLDRPRPFDQDA